MAKKVGYYQHLASRGWALKRAAVKQRAPNRCERCGNGAVQNVHHLSYRNLGDEPLEELQGVCRACHEYLSAARPGDPVAAKAYTLSFHGAGTGSWDQAVLHCPAYAADRTRFLRAEIFDGPDGYKLCNVPGSLLLVLFRCEGGHDFSLNFGPHQGRTLCFWKQDGMERNQ